MFFLYIVIRMGYQSFDMNFPLLKMTLKNKLQLLTIFHAQVTIINQVILKYRFKHSLKNINLFR